MSRIDQIKSLIEAALSPELLDIVDESNQHHRGEETHFKAVIVAEQFDGLNQVKRQQLVYSAVVGEFSEGLHAFSMTTATPAEWNSGKVKVNLSPFCSRKHSLIK